MPSGAIRVGRGTTLVTCSSPPQYFDFPKGWVALGVHVGAHGKAHPCDDGPFHVSQEVFKGLLVKVCQCPCMRLSDLKDGSALEL